MPFERQELHRRLSCPTCHGRFETYPHFGPGNVVVDNCATCDLIWLDFGEMQQIVDAPGRDRGTRSTQGRTEPHSRGPREDDDEEQGTRVVRDNDPLGFLIDVMFDD